jgi:hypothetical protein
MIIPKIGVILNWRNETNKNRLYAIHLCITINRESKYLKIDTKESFSQKLELH